jgi:hypothetical protein
MTYLKTRDRYLLETKLQEFCLTNVPKLTNATHTCSQNTHNTLKTLWGHSGNTLVAWGHLKFVQNTKGVGCYL